MCSDFNYTREVDLSIQLVEERLENAKDPTEVNELRVVKATLQAILAAFGKLISKLV